MASLPLDPVFSHLLLRSEAAGCVAEALTAVSLLSSDNIFLHPHREAEKAAAAQAHRHFASKDGDLPTLLQVYNAWVKVSTHSNALQLCLTCFSAQGNFVSERCAYTDNFFLIVLVLSL